MRKPRLRVTLASIELAQASAKSTCLFVLYGRSSTKEQLAAMKVRTYLKNLEQWVRDNEKV